VDLASEIRRNGDVGTTEAAFSTMGATRRAESLLDPGTFVPLSNVGPESPLAVGTGAVTGMPILLALTDGHVHGGTLGVREAGILARLAERASSGAVNGHRPVALVIGFDTGGVRVEEGPIALAAASAVGVALARLTLTGLRLAAIISGPRGCFGAPAVMAALPERIIMTENAFWGLTGPKLLGDILDGASPEQEALAATSAATRLSNGDAHAVVADTVPAVRAQLKDFVKQPHVGREPVKDRVAGSAALAATLETRMRAAGFTAAAAGHGKPARRRDLLRYSFRGQWRPTGPVQRRGLVDAALGILGDRPALGFIIGPEPPQGGGVGIEEAAVVCDMVRRAIGTGEGARAAILTFLFCQGHAVDYAQERFGLQRALAECLRTLVAARLLGHPIVSVLGGGTYGAAYLALAAPSHRILAMRGTAVAPMAPQVMQAFEALRGHKVRYRAEPQLAELIPDIRMVESVIRLPRVLREELTSLVANVRPEAA
jgi:malonate decarboxylase beta subunit